MVKKLSIVGACKLLANFNNFHSAPLLFMWILVSSFATIDILVHHSTYFDIVFRKVVVNLQIHNWDYFVYSGTS